MCDMAGTNGSGGVLKAPQPLSSGVPVPAED